MTPFRLLAALTIGSTAIATPALAQNISAFIEQTFEWDGEVLSPPLSVDAVWPSEPIVQTGARRLVLPKPNGPIPEQASISVKEGGGRVSLLVPWRGGWLVGTNNGEFGGSLYITDGTHFTTLAHGNVIGGFTWRGNLYVLSGLHHLLLDRGEIWEVDLSASRLARRIALPAMPRAVVAKADGTLIFRTRGGDVALLRDGKAARAFVTAKDD